MPIDSRLEDEHSLNIHFSIQRKCREEKEQKPPNKRGERAPEGRPVLWGASPENLCYPSFVDSVEMVAVDWKY